MIKPLNFIPNNATKEKIASGDYNLFSAKDFFGFNDNTRLVKIIYILISIFLNVIIIISIIKRKIKKNPIALWLTGNILIMNFIHTFSYLFNWTTNLDSSYKFEENEDYKVGSLLIGNPKNNYSLCQIQGFLLIFGSLGQDIAINIFFYVINSSKPPNKFFITIISFVLTYCLPFLFCLILAIVKGFGINERYCYIKKFDFKKDQGTYKYSIYSNFRALIIFIYLLRGISLGISIFLLYKIIKYVRKNGLTKMYIWKSSSILIIQVINIIIGILYRINNIISYKSHKTLSDIFLCVSSLDGILFPFLYSLSNGIYRNLFRRNNSNISSSLNGSEESDESSDNLKDCLSKTSSNSSNKTFAMVDIKDNNNFDLSFL